MNQSQFMNTGGGCRLGQVANLEGSTCPYLSGVDEYGEP